MKITKDMVDQKFFVQDRQDPRYQEILTLKYSGKDFFLVTDEEGAPWVYSTKYDQDFEWVPYEKHKEKKIVRLAPALVKLTSDDDSYCFSEMLYFSALNARNNCSPDVFVKWPANDTSWVEIEVEG